MSDKPSYDPRDKVDLTRIEKRGEWYKIEGRVKGRKTVVEIAAPDIESKSRREAESLMRRSVYGVDRSEKEAR